MVCVCAQWLTSPALSPRFALPAAPLLLYFPRAALPLRIPVCLQFPLLPLLVVMMHRSVSASCSRALLHLRAPAMPHMLPVRAAVAAPAAPAATRALHSARATLAPPPKKEKGARGKAAAAAPDADEDAADAAPQTLDSAAAAGAASSAAKAPRESARDRNASRLAVATSRAQEAKEAADAERRASRVRKAAERQAALESRREKQGIDDVIEKEVPLMDLTGLTPGQNRVRCGGGIRGGWERQE